MKKLAIGIDIGGINTAFGLVDENGDLYADSVVSTKKFPLFTDYPAYVAELTESLHALADSLSFDRYVARRIKWDATDPVARVVYRFKVQCDGSVVLTDLLESTDGRLRRKVVKAVEEAPRWSPATKDGRPVETEHVLRVQLPEGRAMPPERAVILL